MKKSELVTKSALNAIGVFVYVSLIALLLSNAEHIFGEPKSPEILIPIFMLLLFIISACITSFLVLGKPILLYITGAKKDALILLGYTIGWLFLFVLLTGIFLFLK